jgi:hypothetical protein
MITIGTELKWKKEDGGDDTVYRVDSEVSGFAIREEQNSIEIIDPASGYSSGLVTVYKPREGYGLGIRKTAEINWCALGASSIEATQRFIRAMEIAIGFATRLNAGER